MKREQLKKVIRPIVEECVRETLLEGGLLSGVISEVVQGLGVQPIINESRTPSSQPEPAPRINPVRTEGMKRTRKELLDAIGKDSYNGVDLFEGTKPMSNAPAASPTRASSPLSDQDPEDPGVDISGIMKLGGKNWKALLG